MSLPAVEEEEEAEVEDPLEDVAAAPLLDEASLPLKEDILVSQPFLCSDSDFAALNSCAMCQSRKAPPRIGANEQVRPQAGDFSRINRKSSTRGRGARSRASSRERDMYV